MRTSEDCNVFRAQGYCAGAVAGRRLRGDDVGVSTMSVLRRGSKQWGTGIGNAWAECIYWPFVEEGIVGVAWLIIKVPKARMDGGCSSGDRPWGMAQDSEAVFCPRSCLSPQLYSCGPASLPGAVPPFPCLANRRPIWISPGRTKCHHQDIAEYRI